jgi:hypothetical protein
MPQKRPQDKSAEEKLKIVIDAETLPEEQLGAFLRLNGIHEAQLREWRSMMLSGLQKPLCLAEFMGDLRFRQFPKCMI